MAELPGLDELGGVLRAVAALELVHPYGSEVRTLAFDFAAGGTLIATVENGDLELRVEPQLVAPADQRVHDVGSLWPWRAFVGRRFQRWSVVRTGRGEVAAIQLRFVGTEVVAEVGSYGPVLYVAVFTPALPPLAPAESGARDAELLAAIRDAPDDDTPRLVWADLAGGERGELVAVQCRLAHAEDPVLRARERDLLDRHGDTWAGELRGLARGWEFRRGFIEAIEVDASTFVTRADAVVAAAPLARSLTVMGPRRYVIHPEPAETDELRPLEILDRLFELPELARFDRLAFHDAETAAAHPMHVELEAHGDAIAARLVRSGVLAHLRALAIVGSHLTAAGLQALATSGLAHLERVWLRDEDGEPPRFL